MSAPNRPRKCTKTFTGCWACRARKIKCDEENPSCPQCYDKNLSCEGYSARLQWLTPVTGSRGLHSQSLSEGSMSQSLRRLLPAEPLRSTLHLDQIDGILRYLDSLESVINHGREDVSASIQNFGFFSLATAPCSSLADNSGCAAPSLPKALSLADDYDLFFDPGSTLTSSEPCGDNPEIEAAWNLCTLHDEHELPLDFPPRQDLAAPDMPPTIIPVKLRKLY
ncbi:Zn(II)2Cys6 transcription factor domain-containing protein [Aspergillus melleus]|uniref:Zn(II)2Cys6 transcription factor domain-containing protein n=1 Tax=Aspergillus melleus TaxID=138277 RepID=UPI001E8E77DF|nr:arginine metabolism regulation protein II [Aspergillus melleus]KAH8427435.1 arginine metabolism regulation protein II [Aspergillus melleus]